MVLVGYRLHTFYHNEQKVDQRIYFAQYNMFHVLIFNFPRHTHQYLKKDTDTWYFQDKVQIP